MPQEQKHDKPPLESLVADLGPDTGHRFHETGIEPYMPKGSIVLRGNAGDASTHYNVYYQDPQTKKLTLDIIIFRGHNVGNLLSMTSSLSYYRDEPDSLREIALVSKRDLGVLKALVDEISSLYSFGYMEFNLFGIPSDKWKADFGKIKGSLDGIVPTELDNQAYTDKATSFVKLLMEMNAKWQYAQMKFDSEARLKNGQNAAIK